MHARLSYVLLRFLREQYYLVNNESADLPYLHYIGLFTNSLQPESSDAVDDQDDGLNEPAELNPGVIRKKFEMFLRVLAAVVSPRQLYCHQLLFNYYITVLSDPDQTVAKLALQCIINYKPEYITPYKNHCLKLLEPKSLRDELVLFNPAINATTDNATIQASDDNKSASNSSAVGFNTTIEMQHRASLMPILVRLLYGRLLAKASGKKAKEMSQTR